MPIPSPPKRDKKSREHYYEEREGQDNGERKKKEKLTLFRFPSNRAYSSRTSCSRGVRDSVVKEGSCEVVRCVVVGGEAASIVVLLVPYVLCLCRKGETSCRQSLRCEGCGDFESM